eukprot:4684562-Prymnesium_polylepis.2
MGKLIDGQTPITEVPHIVQAASRSLWFGGLTSLDGLHQEPLDNFRRVGSTSVTFTVSDPSGATITSTVKIRVIEPRVSCSRGFVVSYSLGVSCVACPPGKYEVSNRLCNPSPSSGYIPQLCFAGSELSGRVGSIYGAD